MGKSDIAPEKNVARKSSPMVQTIRGVVKTKRRPSANAVPICTSRAPASAAPEVRIVTRARITARNETALTR